jgi:hypothetical protein
MQPITTVHTRRPTTPSTLFVLLAALASVPAAAAGDDCPTWLPDFHCERQARPESSIAPMSMPYLFEDPYVTTGLQLVGIWHEFPRRSALGGGDLYVLALQARVALTDRLAFIATKDGIAFLRPDTPLLDDRNESADITVGFKYALIDSREHDFTLTPALRYEIPLGGKDVFQGRGDGVLIPSASFGWSLEDLGLPKLHVVGSLGGQVAIDPDKDSDSLFYNLQVGYRLHEYFAPFVAVNGMHWTGSGDGRREIKVNGFGKPRPTLNAVQSVLGTGAFEGADFGNLGSRGITGADLVWMTVGARVPLGNGFSVGAAYERPVSNRKDVFKQRVTAMATYEF